MRAYSYNNLINDELRMFSLTSDYMINILFFRCGIEKVRIFIRINKYMLIKPHLHILEIPQYCKVSNHF